MESFWTLASAYQPLHCDISNQVALELCQIRWKRSAHKERSIDFKAELLQTQMLLDNFTHYLLQQEFLFGSISEYCSSTPYGSWQKHPSFPASGQHIPQLTLQLLSKVNPIAHLVTWGKCLTNLWTISICIRAECSGSPSKRNATGYHLLHDATEVLAREHTLTVLFWAVGRAPWPGLCYLTDHHRCDACGNCTWEHQTLYSHALCIFWLNFHKNFSVEIPSIQTKEKRWRRGREEDFFFKN